jgi:hypothetical protein
MGTITRGKFTGSTQSFKSRSKSSKIGSGLTLGSQRKQDLEARAINDKRDQEQAKTKEISRREKERKAMRSDLEKRVSEETNPNRNTDERRKVVNVGRPDTAKNPMDPRAKLVKQAEIKNKIIENQEKSMSLQKYHNLSDDLVAAVRAVLEGKNPFQKKDDDKKSAKKDDDSDDKDVKSKKSDDDDDDDKDTKSSKKSDDSDDEDDDDQDKQVGKGGKKTKVDISPNIKMANEELKGKQKKLDKNHNGKLDAQDFKMLRREDVEAKHITEEKTHTVWFQKGTKVGARSARGVGVTAQNDKHAIELAKKQFPDHKNGWFVDKIKSHAKEEVEQIDELSKNTLASYKKKSGVDMNDARDRAIKHFDDNKATGSVDSIIKGNKEQKHFEKRWKGLAKANKKLKEEASLSDEETARILAKLNEADDEDEKHDGPEHIVMQLRKAKSLGANNRPIHFHDGSKVKVHGAHVQKALDMHGSFKKAPEKDEFTQKLQASHASFKKAIGEG